LKGSTSLSKGFQIIKRFSEDIDIRIEPPKGRQVRTGRNHDKPAHIQSRREFYDWLAKTIRINGIEEVERDTRHCLRQQDADSGPSRTVVPTHRGQRSDDCGRLLMSV
jgi:hypothetical protein